MNHDFQPNDIRTKIIGFQGTEKVLTYKYLFGGGRAEMRSRCYRGVPS